MFKFAKMSMKIDNAFEAKLKQKIGNSELN